MGSQKDHSKRRSGKRHGRRDDDREVLCFSTAAMARPVSNAYAVTHALMYGVGAPGAQPILSPYNGFNTESGYIQVPAATAWVDLGSNQPNPRNDDAVGVFNYVANPTVTPYVNALPAIVTSSLYKVRSVPSPMSPFYVLQPYNMLSDPCNSWEVGDKIAIAYGPSAGGYPIVQMGTLNGNIRDAYLGPKVISGFLRITNPLPLVEPGKCKDKALRAEFAEYGSDCSSSSESCSSSSSSSSCSSYYSESCGTPSCSDSYQDDDYCSPSCSESYSEDCGSSSTFSGSDCYSTPSCSSSYSSSSSGCRKPRRCPRGRGPLPVMPPMPSVGYKDNSFSSSSSSECSDDIKRRRRRQKRGRR